MKPRARAVKTNTPNVKTNASTRKSRVIVAGKKKRARLTSQGTIV